MHTSFEVWLIMSVVCVVIVSLAYCISYHEYCWFKHIIFRQKNGVGKAYTATSTLSQNDVIMNTTVFCNIL
jgi:hypothetical protein